MLSNISWNNATIDLLVELCAVSIREGVKMAPNTSTYNSIDGIGVSQPARRPKPEWTEIASK